VLLDEPCTHDNYMCVSGSVRTRNKTNRRASNKPVYFVSSSGSTNKYIIRFNTNTGRVTNSKFVRETASRFTSLPRRTDNSVVITRDRMSKSVILSDSLCVCVYRNQYPQRWPAERHIQKNSKPDFFARM